MMAVYFNPLMTFQMADGAEHTVKIVNPDMLRWEKERTSLKCTDDDKITSMTFLAWAAARRTNLIPDMSWPEFSQQCYGIRSDEAEAVDPTQPGAGPG